MERYAERMRLPFNDFCCGCRSTEEEETVIHSFCQYPSLARHGYRLFGSSFFGSLTELFSINIKDADPLRKRRLLSTLFVRCPSLARHSYRLFGSSFLGNLTELFSIDIKDITSYIELSGWFSSVGYSCSDV